jgi:small GTP-binding protein
MKPKDKKSTIKQKTYQIITIGDSYAGKTCLLSYYIQGKTIIGDPSPTIGVEVQTKKEKINQATKTFNFYDTGGSERFHNMATTYYRKAEGALLVFDLTSEDSFSHVRKWAETLYTYKKKDSITLFLVGNKVDLIENRDPVTFARYQAMAKELETELFITSALTGEGVNDCFKKLLEKLVEKNPDPNDEVGTVDLKVPEKKKKKFCKSN